MPITTPNNPQQKKNEWLTEDRVIEYLARADRLPHRLEGESVMNRAYSCWHKQNFRFRHWKWTPNSAIEKQ